MKSTKKRDLRLKKVLLIGILTGAVAGIIIMSVITGIRLGGQRRGYEETITELESKNQNLQNQLNDEADAEEIAKISAETLAAGEEGWSLVLVNEDCPLDTAYAPSLEEIASGYFVDARILEETSQMLSDAQEEGLSMYICSAYRAYDTQREVFNSTMVDWINQGKSPLDAYDETKKSVAVPGTSEHATGLALDIVSTEYGELDEKQAETAEAKWLAENCWKYGFILRYPPEKADITGIIYEPWHYRYVGQDAAKEIMEQGITLEEYLKK